MYKILVDTDVLIDFSKGKNLLLKDLFILQKQGKTSLYITPVNVTEFLNDTLLENVKKLDESMEFLENFKIAKLGKQSGVLAGKYLRLGKTSYLGDALIGASCVESGLVLATRNKKHFEKIPNLKFYTDLIQN